MEPRPDVWMFPSETGKTSAGKDKVWRRHIGPKLKGGGLGLGGFPRDASNARDSDERSP